MKRFLLKIFSLAAAVAIGMAGLNTLYEHSQGGGASKVFENVPEHIQICNFGSSHGQGAFRYDKVDGYTCFNFALGGQDLVYDEILLEYYRDRIDPGAVIYFPVSYFSFNGRGDDEVSLTYLNILPRDRIPGYSVEKEFYAHFPLLVAYQHPLELMIDWVRSTLYQAKTGTLGQPKPEVQTADSINFAYSVETRYKSHFGRAMRDENGEMIKNPKALDALCRCIALCREMGARPVLVTTPFTKEYHDAAVSRSPKDVEDFYAQVQKIVSETGVEYYDYSCDPRFESHEYFGDADHMNSIGGENFTEIVLRETQAIE